MKSADVHLQDSVPHTHKEVLFLSTDRQTRWSSIPHTSFMEAFGLNYFFP